jgi:hypothetical protein
MYHYSDTFVRRMLPGATSCEVCTQHFGVVSELAKSELIVCGGSFFVILWGLASNGRCQARNYYESLEVADRARALALFKRMADIGKIYDKTKFNKETEKLYVFKPQPHRFFCFFMKGRKIFIVSAYHKQGDKAPLQEIARAENLRMECLKRLARQEERHEKKQR